MSGGVKYTGCVKIGDFGSIFDVHRLITFEGIEQSASDLADIEDGPLLRPDHKTTPKWAWPRSRDRISKFWDPPYNF